MRVLAMWVALPGCVLLGDADRAAKTDADGDGVPESLDCDDRDALLGRPTGETCNGLDDDCDGQVDEGLAPDADGDGHGAAESEGPCLEPWVPAGSDCDDANPAVHPGAFERCDGVDNGCMPQWAEADESGVVTWVPESGVAEDWTPVFAEGGAVRIDSPGTLSVCAGDVADSVRLVVETGGRVEVRGRAVAGHDATLQAGGGGPVLDASGDGLMLTVSDLVLQGGLSTFQRPGGGISVSGADEVRLERVVVEGNLAALDALGGTGLHAGRVSRLVVLDSAVRGNTGGPDSRGAGIGLVDTDARMTRTTVADNTSYEVGGGIATEGGRLVLSEVAVADNVASFSGGGLYVGTDTKAFLYDSFISGNLAGQGAGATVFGAMSCFAGAETGGGFHDNEAVGRGAALALVETGRASFDGCAAEGHTLSEPRTEADAGAPDLWIGEDGASATIGHSFRIIGTWLYCDVWSLCQGDVAE